MRSLLASKKKLVAGLVALGAFGALTASASSLGGLRSTSVGASANVVASCDTDGVDISYSENAWHAATNDYRSNVVTLSGVNAACEGQAFRLTLSNASASLAETVGTITLSSGKQAVTLSSPVRSEDVARTSLVITG